MNASIFNKTKQHFSFQQ